MATNAENRIDRPDGQALRQEPQRKRRSSEYCAGGDPRCPQGRGGSAPDRLWILWGEGRGTDGRESPETRAQIQDPREAATFLRGQGPLGGGDRVCCGRTPQQFQACWLRCQQFLPKQGGSFPEKVTYGRCKEDALQLRKIRGCEAAGMSALGAHVRLRPPMHLRGGEAAGLREGRRGCRCARAKVRRLLGRASPSQEAEGGPDQFRLVPGDHASARLGNDTSVLAVRPAPALRSSAGSRYWPSPARLDARQSPAYRTAVQAPLGFSKKSG